MKLASGVHYVVNGNVNIPVGYLVFDYKYQLLNTAGARGGRRQKERGGPQRRTAGRPVGSDSVPWR